jgi:hypothetical protein
MKLSVLIAIIVDLASSAVACVDFSAEYCAGDEVNRRFSAKLIDNGVQRCQIQDFHLPDMLEFVYMPPIELQCDEGFWAGFAFVNGGWGFLRYAHHAFDEVILIAAPATIRDGIVRFRETAWVCDYHPGVDFGFLGTDLWEKSHQEARREAQLANKQLWDPALRDENWAPFKSGKSWKVAKRLEA